ncbi:MAG TPA: hypothetical protein VF855_10140 [Acidimicrobiales bacterium]
MSEFVFTGEPQLSGTVLKWGGTLNPGTMEMAAEGSIEDSVDIFRMWADDAAGTQQHSELVMQGNRPLTDSVMPGDSYSASMDLHFPQDGYYHVLLTLDNVNNGPCYELHVRVEDGQTECKSLYLKYP